jgi:hypothetical protein
MDNSVSDSLKSQAWSSAWGTWSLLEILGSLELAILGSLKLAILS